MSRLLAMLVVLAGLVLVAPPAEAALSVTITASRTALMHGESVTFSGKAVHAKRGSVVKLQRRTGAGWKTVASRKVWSQRTYRFTTTPPRGNQKYRVVKPRRFGQARVVSRTVRVAVRWRPTISVSSTGNLDPAGDVWVTTVTGTAPELRGIGLAVERYAEGSWSATEESVLVGSDGQFSHVIAGGAAGSRYRYASPASGLRLRAWSDPVTVAAEVYTPTIDISVRPEQQISNLGVYDQSQRVTGATNAPEAPVAVEVNHDRDHTGEGVWRRYWSGSAAADGSFEARLPNLPEGTRLRVIVEPSADGLRKEAVSDEVTTTLIPIPLTLDGPRVNVNDVTPDRGALLEMNATAGDLITFYVGQAYEGGGGKLASWRLYGPDGSEVPEQTFVRGSTREYVSRYYRPTTTGTHTLVLSALDTDWWTSEEVTVYASTPKVVPVALDQEKTVSVQRSGQPIDLEFTGAADQAVSIFPPRAEWSCPSAQLYVGDDLVPRRFASTPVLWHMHTAWELPLSGTYRMRLWPCDTLPLKTTMTVVSAEEVQLEYRTDTRIDLGRRGSYGVARFTTTAGTHIQLEKVAWNSDGTALVTAPDGSLILETDFIAPQTGTYKLWLGPGSESYSYATWRATESNH